MNSIEDVNVIIQNDDNANEELQTISSSIVFAVASRGVQAKLSTDQITTGTENPITINGGLSQDLDNPKKSNELQVLYKH